MVNKLNKSDISLCSSGLPLYLNRQFTKFLLDKKYIKKEKFKLYGFDVCVFTNKGMKALRNNN